MSDLGQFYFSWTNRGIFAAPGYGPRAATPDLESLKKSDWAPLLDAARISQDKVTSLSQYGGTSLALLNVPEIGRLVLYRSVDNSTELRYFVHCIVDPLSMVDFADALGLLYTGALVSNDAHVDASSRILPCIARDDVVGVRLRSGLTPPTKRPIQAAIEVADRVGRQVQTLANLTISDFRETLWLLAQLVPAEVRRSLTFDDFSVTSVQTDVRNSPENAEPLSLEVDPSSNRIFAPGPVEGLTRHEWLAVRRHDQRAVHEVLADDSFTPEHLLSIAHRPDLSTFLAAAGAEWAPHIKRLKGAITEDRNAARLPDLKAAVAAVLSRFASTALGSAEAELSQGQVANADKQVRHAVDADPLVALDFARSCASTGTDPGRRLLALRVYSALGRPQPVLDESIFELPWEWLAVADQFLNAKHRRTAIVVSLVRSPVVSVRPFESFDEVSWSALEAAFSIVAREGEDERRALAVVNIAKDVSVSDDAVAELILGAPDHLVTSLLQRTPLRLSREKQSHVEHVLARRLVSWLAD